MTEPSHPNAPLSVKEQRMRQRGERKHQEKLSRQISSTSGTSSSQSGANSSASIATTEHGVDRGKARAHVKLTPQEILLNTATRNALVHFFKTDSHRSATCMEDLHSALMKWLRTQPQGQLDHFLFTPAFDKVKKKTMLLSKLRPVTPVEISEMTPLQVHHRALEVARNRANKFDQALVEKLKNMPENRTSTSGLLCPVTYGSSDADCGYILDWLRASDAMSSSVPNRGVCAVTGNALPTVPVTRTVLPTPATAWKTAYDAILESYTETESE